MTCSGEYLNILKAENSATCLGPFVSDSQATSSDIVINVRRLGASHPIVKNCGETFGGPLPWTSAF